jgi:hypothetical protein
MKKTILLILVCSLLLLTVTSCLQNNKNEQTTPQNTTEETTPETIKNAIELKPAPTTPIPTGLLAKNSDLIVTLRIYLKRYSNSMRILDDIVINTSNTFASKINSIKNGTRPIHVAFDSDSNYFVCGYFNPADGHTETRNCCCDEYTWIGYQNENEIQEYLNDMKCIVAFQINKALTVTDLLDADADAPNMEHFQIYKPTFENGINIGAPIDFSETFIYLENPNKDTIYYSISSSDHKNKTISCMRYEGKYYLSFHLHTIYDNGNRDEGINVAVSFGEYYTAIVSVMKEVEYDLTGSSNGTSVYGLISFEDFVNVILN